MFRVHSWLKLFVPFVPFCGYPTAGFKFNQKNFSLLSPVRVFDLFRSWSLLVVPQRTLRLCVSAVQIIFNPFSAFRFQLSGCEFQIFEWWPVRLGSARLSVPSQRLDGVLRAFP